jgi:diaminohydroxyphosphoribosylaminopyrimidine deaminase/5-amino-6-(5-phosphoribosylamino)uracil reductase
MEDPNPLVAGNGLKKLRNAGIEIETGLLEAQARELNPGFIKRMEAGRPFVRVKLAMSLDGRTAMASGESKWISSDASRIDVQRLRAASSAVLTGIGTVLADDPSMNVRLSATDLGVDKIKHPKRIVLDSQLKLPETAKIIYREGDSGGECIVYTTVNVDNKNDYPFIIENSVTLDGKIDLQLLMKDLANKEMNLLHVEAGSVLCGALLKNDLVDEIIVYVAPHIMGDGAKGLFHLPGLEKMDDRISLHLKDVRSVGNDIRITLQPEYCV